MNDKRLKKIIVVAIALVFAFAYVLAYLLPKNRPNTQAIQVSSSLSSTAAFGADSFVFSNSQTLEVHNYLTGETRAIAPTNAGLNTIDDVSVSPNGKYVLFHDRVFNTNGVVGTILNQQNLDVGLDYWWLYNVSTQSFQYLPQGVVLAKLDNNSVYVLSASAGTEQIATYRNSDLHQTAAISVIGSSDFYPVSGGFLLQTPDGELVFTKDGVVSNELIQSFSIVGVTSDGQTAVGTSTNSHSLIAINLKDGTTSTIATGILNAPAWLNTGAVLYLNSRNHLTLYNLQTHKSNAWYLGGELSKADLVNLKLVSLVGPSAAIIMSQSGVNYLVGPKLSTNPIK